MLWVNEHASGVGGCEVYIRRTARLLGLRGVESHLAFSSTGSLAAEYAAGFRTVRRWTGARDLLEQVSPDIVFLHKLSDESVAEELLGQGLPVVRFIHDHHLFCLREHKYTAIRERTCVRPAGLRCSGCAGWISRRAGARLTLRSLRSLRREQEICRQFDACVVSSEYLRTHAIAHGFSPERVHRIPLYVSPLQGGVPSPREPNLIAFAGQLVRGKGVDLLIEALARTRTKPRLEVAGSGTQEAEFRKLARTLGVEGRIKWLGRLDEQRVHGLFGRAAVAVVPSRAPETFGLVGLEAMRVGTPVIAARVGGIGEWLRDGKNGRFFETGDVRGLARAIDDLVENPGTAQRLGAQAARDCQHFRAETHASQLVDLFEHLITEVA